MGKRRRKGNALHKSLLRVSFHVLPFYSLLVLAKWRFSIASTMRSSSMSTGQLYYIFHKVQSPETYVFCAQYFFSLSFFLALRFCIKNRGMTLSALSTAEILPQYLHLVLQTSGVKNLVAMWKNRSTNDGQFACTRVIKYGFKSLDNGSALKPKGRQGF